MFLLQTSVDLLLS